MLKRLVVTALSMLLAVSLLPLVACDNPFDPLTESDKIEGLTYVDFSGAWDRWDSDPEYDGFVITPEYYNEFGDSLTFRNKPHKIRIEYWTQKEINMDHDPETGDPIPGSGQMTYDTLVFSHEVTYKNTSAVIRIPKELYEGNLRSHGFQLDEEEATVYILLHFFPPKAYPQEELIVGSPDQTVFKPESGPTPNE